MEKLYFSRKEAAAMLGVCERTVRNLEERGDLKAYRLGIKAGYTLADIKKAARPHNHEACK